MDNNSHSDLFVYVAVLLAVFLGVSAVQEMSGIDKGTLLRIVMTITVWPSIWYFFPTSFRYTWLLGLACVWFCFWPALDYWSDLDGIGFLVGHERAAPMWYDTAITKFGVLFAMLAGNVYANRSYLPWR